jgi:uncharacterized lipoprotein NlpE involved in copper resistance
MKKVAYAAVAMAVLFVFVACGKHNETAKGNYAAKGAAHNSQNSLDWYGTYRGVVPCADCEGIEVELTLTQKGTYELKYTYLGKGKNSYKEAGNFKWDGAAGNITLLGIKEYPPYYKVGENMLLQLDMEGKKITGNLANNYKLEKVKVN